MEAPREVRFMRQHESLPESQLYTFVDRRRELALYFLEGQRLIHDLALVHPVRGAGFAYFRDAVLSVQPMIALLKHGEQLGFYIDSNTPFFRLKIETTQQGAVRCSLMPEAFEEFPEAMSGMVRVLKLFPNNRPPYQSVLDVGALPLREIVNRVLRDSYQVQAVIEVSERSDQSSMLLRLPAPAGPDHEHAADRPGDEIVSGVREILRAGLQESDAIEAAFADLGCHALARRSIRLVCSCTRDRMVRNIKLAFGDQYPDLFDPHQDALDITCEYCKSRYVITRDDLHAAHGAPN